MPRRSRPLAVLFAIASLISACQPRHVLVADEGQVPQTSKHRPHPDYARLRPWRPYLQVTNLGRFGDQFVVWFLETEQSVCDAVVAPEKTPEGRFEVAVTNCAFGGLAYRPEDVPPIPAEVSAKAKAAIAAVDEHHAGRASDFAVAWLGQFRRVYFRELIPYLPAGSFDRPASTSEASVAADRDLTRIVGGAHFWTGPGGETRLCWEGRSGELGCAVTPHWVELPEGAPLVGGPSVVDALARGPSKPQALPLHEPLLAAARRLEAGDAPLPVEALLEKQEESAVPSWLDQRVRLDVSLYARAAQPRDQRGAQPELVFRVADLVAQGAEVTAPIPELGVTLRTSMGRLTVPEEGVGKATATLHVEIAGWGEESRALELELEGSALVADGRAAVLALGPMRERAGSRPDIRLGPRAGFTQLDVYVGSLRPVLRGGEDTTAPARTTAARSAN